MSIKLVEIKMDNFEECINLNVDDSQKGFVVSNSYSLCEAYADKVSVPLAIYSDDKMVGFVMYDFDPYIKSGYISKLMIDSRFQKKGYGREALEAVVQILKNIPGCKCIQTCYHRNNKNAGKLCEEIGFIKTGDVSSNDEVVCMFTI